MNLGQVLDGVKLRSELSPAVAAMTVAGLEYDSRRVEKDFLFFAFAGSRVDGRKFAQEALARGASAVVSELPRPDGFRRPMDRSGARPPRAGHRCRQFLPASRRAGSVHRHHGNQRQDHHIVPGGRDSARSWIRHRTDRDHRIPPGGRTSACGQHDARIARRDALCSGAGTSRRPAPHHGSFVSRARVGTGVRDPLPYRGIHESDARSSRFSPHHGRVRRRQANAVRAARFAGAALVCAECRRSGESRAWPAFGPAILWYGTGARAQIRRREYPLRLRRPALRPGLRRRAPAHRIGAESDAST